MATINPVRDPDVSTGSVAVFTYTDAANGDTVTPIGLGAAAGALLSIQITASAGGTTTAQISNDGTTWNDLKDVTGLTVSVATGATGIFDVSTAARFLRINPGSGVTAASATIVMREVAD